MSGANGQKVETSVARYLPYGRWRTEPTADLTDRAYTGQKHNMDIGLYYYNARYYAPGVGRFISADTLVPDPTNPQQFNRYAYVLNNPLRFTDPTGHYCYDPTFGDAAGQCYSHNGYLVNGPSTGAILEPIRRRDPLDELWNRVMDAYYEGALWKVLGNVSADGVSIFADIGAGLLYWEGHDLAGGDFFKAMGKGFDGFSLLMDAANYAASTEAIYKAWLAADFDITDEELRYLNTRAAAEAFFSAGLTVSPWMLGPGAGLAANGVEFGWNMWAAMGENRLGPDGLLAKSYATNRYRYPSVLGANNAIDGLADFMTMWMMR